MEKGIWEKGSSPRSKEVAVITHRPLAKKGFALKSMRKIDVSQLRKGEKEVHRTVRGYGCKMELIQNIRKNTRRAFGTKREGGGEQTVCQLFSA